MYTRNLIHSIKAALEDTPVIVLVGARQTGKSTLCEQILEQEIFRAKLVTFDDPTTLMAAQADPLGFLEGLGEHVIVDEVQRVPELFTGIKKLVDEDRENRRLILTGSANVMNLPKVSESLAGRMEILHLWPLSQDEIIGKPSKFLHMLISGQKFPSRKLSWKDMIEALEIGGYPEALNRESETRRYKWFESYLGSILQKDIRDLSNIEGLTQIPNILNLLGARVGSTMNLSEISRLSGVKNSTLKRYMALLENIFVIVRVPAWTPNVEGPFVKSTKIYLNDTGLLCYLRGEDRKSLADNRAYAGVFLENFVVMELMKQLSWSNEFIKTYHFSMHKGAEVDLVLEDRKKRLYGIEVKASATLHKNDFKGLKRLAELSPKFQQGMVLYMGEESLRFGDGLYAIPMAGLWMD